MFVVVKIPVSWFNDDLSRRACERLEAKVIPANKWVTLETLYSFPLRDDFTLQSWLYSKKLKAIIFDDEYEKDFRFHPDSILAIVKTELRKRMRRIRK